MIYLHMQGIPCALGRNTYLSVWQEVGSLCVEHFSPFCFLPSPPSAFHFVSVWQVPVFSGMWGFKAGLSGFASHRCSLPLGALKAPGCLHRATQIMQIIARAFSLPLKLSNGWSCPPLPSISMVLWASIPLTTLSVWQVVDCGMLTTSTTSFCVDIHIQHGSL